MDLKASGNSLSACLKQKASVWSLHKSSKSTFFVVSLWMFALVCEGRRGLWNPAVSGMSVFVSRLLSIHQICRHLIKWQLCLLSYWSHSSTSFLFVLLVCLWRLRCGVVLSTVHRPSVCVPRQRPVATSQVLLPGQIRAACWFSNKFLLFLKCLTSPFRGYFISK